jgi:signal transduction histidine kinase
VLLLTSLREPVDVIHALECDPDLLRRVLLNLIDNALRYSPPGSLVQLEADATDGGV